MSTQQGHLESYYLNSKCSDVVLCAALSEGTCIRIPAHKFVLSTRSPVFEKMLEANNFKEGTTGVVDINIAGGEDVARAFVRFFYYGNVQNECLTHALALMKTSHLYSIDTLVKICETNILEGLTPENVCEVYEEIKTLGSDKFLENVLALMTRTAFIIFRKECHLILSEDSFATLLKSEILNVSNEMHAADALWQWGRWKCLKTTGSSSHERIEEAVKNLAPLVRWNTVNKAQCESATWKRLADKFSDTCTSRNPVLVPSILKFASIVDLFRFSHTFYYRDLKCKENKNNLIKFSTNRDAYLVGIELDFTVEDSIVDKIGSSLELKLDERVLNLTTAKQSTLGVELLERMKFWSSRFVLELDKPYFVNCMSSHVLTLKTLCEEHKVQMPRYEIGLGVVPNPKKSTRNDVFFIIHEKIFSVMKLYYVPS